MSPVRQDGACLGLAVHAWDAHHNLGSEVPREGHWDPTWGPPGHPDPLSILGKQPAVFSPSTFSDFFVKKLGRSADVHPKWPSIGSFPPDAHHGDSIAPNVEAEARPWPD